jgi:hypothetical protein
MPHPRRPPPPISSPVVVAAIDKIPNFRSLLVEVLLAVSGPVLASYWGRIYHGCGQAILIPLPELQRALSSRQSRNRT